MGTHAGGRRAVDSGADARPVGDIGGGVRQNIPSASRRRVGRGGFFARPARFGPPRAATPPTPPPLPPRDPPVPRRPPPAPPLLACLLLAAAPAFAQGPPPVVVDGFFETVDAVDLAAERPGMLRRVPFREGDRVEVDQVVAELWDEVPRAQLATQELQATDRVSELYAVEAARVAQAELEGLLAANERKDRVVVETEINRARLSLKQAKAQILKARQERELAGSRAEELRAELQSYVVAAPFPGVVQRVMHLPGESVRQGDPVVHLVNTDRLRVVANVPLEQVLALRVGDLAAAQPQTGGGNAAPVPLPLPPAAGRVTFIDPTETQRDSRSLVRVFVEVPNLGGVYRAGLSAALTIRPGTAPPPGAGDAAEFLTDEGADLLQGLVPGGGAGTATAAGDRTRTARFRPGTGGGADGAGPAEVPRTRLYAGGAGGR